VKKIGKALVRDWQELPLSPHIKQRLLLYGAHSKIAHTHCLVALSPDATKAKDSIIEKLSRNIWGIPTSVQRAGLHAPIEEIGLSIPSIWEDFCGTALRSLTQILNDEEALGTTARASYMVRPLNFATNHWNWPSTPERAGIRSAPRSLRETWSLS